MVLSGVWWSSWLCVITVLLCLPAVWRHWAVRCQSRRTTTPSTSTRTGGTSSKASRGRSRNNQPPGQSRIIRERQKQRQKHDRTRHSIFRDLTYNRLQCLQASKWLKIQKKVSLNTFKVAEVAGLGQRQREAFCSEACPGDHDDDCMVLINNCKVVINDHDDDLMQTCWQFCLSSEAE